MTFKSLLFVCIASTGLCASAVHAVGPNPANREHAVRAVSRGLVYLKQEALRILKQRLAHTTTDGRWYLTELYHSNHLAALRDALSEERSQELRRLIARFDNALDIPAITSRKLAAARDYAQLVSWIESELRTFNALARASGGGQPNASINQAGVQVQGQTSTTRTHSAPMGQRPAGTRGVSTPVETASDPASRMPASGVPGLGAGLDHRVNGQAGQEDQLGLSKLFGQSLGWMGNNKLLTGALGLLTVYSVCAELFGWFPFREQAQDQT